MRFLGLGKTAHCIVCEERVTKEFAVLLCDELCICGECAERIEQYKSTPAFEGRDYLKFLISAFPYSGALRDAFAKFKFFGQEGYGKIFAQLLADSAKDLINPGDFDIIVPVPLSRQRMSERGFNQAAVMAKAVAERYGIAYSENVLFRIRNTKRQSGLSVAERNINVRDAFLADGLFAARKRILLVDDIYTRGATMSECARVLYDADAYMTAGMTLFKTHLPDNGGPAAGIRGAR